MELYQRLISSIESRIGVALITVTRIDLHDPNHYWQLTEFTVGTKLLVYASGNVFCEKELAMEDWQPLLENAKMALANQKSHTCISQIKSCEIEYFVDVYPQPLHLIVVGAGHVAKPLVEMGNKLGFYITVICDRPQFANNEQFPWADEVVCRPYTEYFRNLDISDRPYILLLTRGHQYDVAILREILHLSVPYIGMIGSRRRISGVFSQLHEDLPDVGFQHVYAPIGLDIGAQTPEEIAISVLAEILRVKNQKSGRSLKEEVRHFIVDRQVEEE
ncbi:XdhC family protein [Paenibacillus roseipurpureus]|uniref:XdhC family protein n=1 Tax=Paenibacillus roseopurpureus TaxID=2918901 RepID=A0AA96LTI0_9BACL|nr:XdhC family protein [Paenibacillus sp. MBLB1832]WNR45774.1 XdhC family protein [Paenibacillus sp. MBLB1832]